MRTHPLSSGRARAADRVLPTGRVCCRWLGLGSSGWWRRGPAMAASWKATVYDGVERNGDQWRCTVCSKKGRGHQWRRHGAGPRHTRMAARTKPAPAAAARAAAPAAPSRVQSRPAAAAAAATTAAAGSGIGAAVASTPLHEHQSRVFDGTCRSLVLRVVLTRCAVCDVGLRAVVYALARQHQQAVPLPHHTRRTCDV